MSPTLPSWIGRIAALALLLGLFWGLYAAVVAPVLAERARIARELADGRDLFGRYRALAQGREVLRSRLDELAAQQAESGIYLGGETDALAGAELQEIVNGLVESGGGRLRSVQILPVKADGDFRRVGVRIQLMATVAQALRILYALEGGRTYLFIDTLDISNRRARRRKGQTDPDPELLIRLDLSGYLRPSVG